MVCENVGMREVVGGGVDRALIAVDEGRLDGWDL